MRRLHKNVPYKFFFYVLAFLFLIGGSSGCEPLRKKFTRKKKEEKVKGVEPILEPIDYAPLIHAPIERYKYHYNLWHVWHKECITALSIKDNDKRIKYFYDQSSINAMFHYFLIV